MVVHDIEVDDVGPGGQNLVDVLAQAGEIGGKNGGGNSVGLHGAPVGGNHGGAHCNPGKRIGADWYQGCAATL